VSATAIKTAINWSGVAAAAGGVGFAGFWMGSLLKVEVVPWPVALLWHALVTIALTVGAVGIHRASHGSPTQTVLGWLGVAFIAAGQVMSLEIVMLGYVIFGAAVAMAPRLPRSSGALLAVGAVGFLVTAALNGPFWGEPNPSPSLIPGLTFGASLLCIALGWIVLGVSITAGGSSCPQVIRRGSPG
jgi:hypothetical protein